MLKAIMIVRPQRAEILCQRMLGCDWIDDITATECRGYGRQKGHLENYRDGEYAIEFLPKVVVTAVIADVRADELVELVCTTCRTGRIGDGKIIFMAVGSEIVY
jgi:nitrogen regulatory protein PII